MGVPVVWPIRILIRLPNPHYGAAEIEANDPAANSGDDEADRRINVKSPLLKPSLDRTTYNTVHGTKETYTN